MDYWTRKDGIDSLILNQDCFQVMKDFVQPGSVDLIVTSPPYNLGKNYPCYDDKKGWVDYLDWLRDWASLAQRVLSPQGSLFLNIGGKPSEPWRAFEIAHALRGYFHIQNVIAWVKSLAIDGVTHGHYKPINSAHYLNDCFEYILHLTHKGKVQINRLAVGVPYMDQGNLKRGNRGKNGNLRCAGNVWHIPYETIQSRDIDRPHEATFPVDLPRRCMKLHGITRIKMAFDPFMGLGSSAIAANELGVPFIGCDTAAEYCRYAYNILTLLPGVEGKVLD